MSASEELCHQAVLIVPAGYSGPDPTDREPRERGAVHICPAGGGRLRQAEEQKSPELRGIRPHTTETQSCPRGGR